MRKKIYKKNLKLNLFNISEINLKLWYKLLKQFLHICHAIQQTLHKVFLNANLKLIK
jgi:hypothetical protein